MSKKSRKKHQKKKGISQNLPNKEITFSRDAKRTEKVDRKKPKVFLYLIPVLALFLSAFGFYLFSGAKNKVKRDDSLNVLLITLDTTRADHIGAYGWAKAKTPNIDALAAKGVRFANAYCPTPLTLPSHCSILTGTYPLYHKVRNNGSYYLGQDAVTLAEKLKERGYKTSAFVASFNVDSRFGVDQGFDYYDDKFSDDEMLKTFRSERKADKVADSFIAWFDVNSEQKFFSWVHLFDPHMPHDPPSPYKEEFAGNLYDGEIAFMDHHFGRIIDRLREKNVLDKTLIVVAGDHGEALGEKEELDHGIFIYDVTMKVPLIFYGEKCLPEGFVADSRVGLIDIMPSILEMVKIPVNKEVQGTSLIPYIEGKKKEDLPCYLETYYPPETFGWSELQGFIDGDWKYIKAPRSELYNLKEDKNEENNLLSKESKTVARLKDKLESAIREYSSKKEAGRRTMTQEEEDRLRSLGYIGADASAKIAKGPLPDPKDKMGEFRILYQAKLMEYEGKLEESEKGYREMLRLAPDVSWHYIGLAILLAREKRFGESIEVIKDGLKRMPDSVVLMSRLASFYMRTGNFKDAFEMSLATLKRDPKHFDALVIAGWAEDMRGNWQESARYFGEALKIEPENRYTRLKYAYSLGALGRGDEAVVIDEALKKEYPKDFRIYKDLGVIYTSLKKLDLAEENLKKAVELSPSPDTYLSYAAILGRVGKLADAITYLKLYLENTKEGDTPRKLSAQKALTEWEKRVKGQ
jgi:arylsulfatase A-like enzyme/predicted Zn-dependent protease